MPPPRQDPPPNTVVHHLKTHQPYWLAIRDGTKTFDVRPNDRNYQVGDVLHLVATEDGKYYPPKRIQYCTYHRYCLHRKVLFMFSGDEHLPDGGGLVPGYVVLALAEVEESSAAGPAQT